MSGREFRRKLEEKTTRIAVWGGGTIGYSTLVYYCARGIAGTAYDISEKRVDEINQGKVSICGMDSWLDEDLDALTNSGLMRATNRIEDILNEQHLIHFLAIPTEERGVPQTKILEETFKYLCEAVRSQPNFRPLIIIESTTTPGTIEKILCPLIRDYGVELGKDLLLASAPRRDWFNDGGYSVWDMDRVFGGIDEESTRQTEGVLGIICNKLHRSSSASVAEMTKVVENAYRFVELSLANQLAHAYPDVNIREVLELASTKWNVGLYLPGLGVGGHCIPVAPRHIIAGSSFPERLPLVEGALESEDAPAANIAAKIRETGAKNVAIIGLAYRPDMNICVFSPTIRVSKELQREGLSVGILDCLFSQSEIEIYTGAEALQNEEDIFRFDALILAAPHSIYTSENLMKRIAGHNFLLVVDNSFTYAAAGVKPPSNYFVIGTGVKKVQLRECRTGS